MTPCVNSCRQAIHARKGYSFIREQLALFCESTSFVA